MTPYRPSDDEYWIPNWASILFAGDLFAAIPFLNQPAVTLVDGEGSGKHFVGEVQYGYGLLVSPTCDMIDQHTGEPSHPYRVLVPVLPLSMVAELAPGQRQNLGMIEARDSVHPYMYLPPVPGLLEEPLVACLYRPSLVDDALLRDPPRRVAQLHQEARRQLKIKLARYWGRVDPERDPIPLEEVDEERYRSAGPSAYDIETGSLEDAPSWPTT
jgi:hypothetical protein